MPQNPKAVNQPNGSTHMEIESINPHAAPIIDLSQRPAFNEQIPLPLKRGQIPVPLIVPADPTGTPTKVDDSVHPGDWGRPGYDSVTRT